ncbi:saccharopine dehydrogenase NADP-binding domain-containing protein [Micromonospora sp. NBC_01412]|uniref:saccharopine dehydrogenase NADP-binding domain-containing protein n=1 Tax=Micromonospora sp. NBC_01412 TaxID=2903590 RepID=UPI003245B4D9
MNDGRQTIGVLGAYGHVGRNVVRELARYGGYELLLGGRDPERLAELAAGVDGSPATQVVDVFDQTSVADFAQRCAVLVNCSRYSDAFAQAVLDSGCHLVDTTAFRAERWQEQESALRDKGIRWITYTGWLPGLPDIVVRYLETVGAARLGPVASVEVYAYDCNEYLGYGLLDLVGGIFYGPGVLDAVQRVTRRRRPTPTPPSADMSIRPEDRKRSKPRLRFAELPAPVGRKLVMSDSADHNREVFLAYDAELLIPVVRSFWHGTTKGEQWLADRVVGPAFRRRVRRRGVAQVLRGRVHAENGQQLQVDLVETRRDGYWLSGVIPATAARLVVEDKVAAAGIATLDKMADPLLLADELASVGVDYRVG